MGADKVSEATAQPSQPAEVPYAALRIALDGLAAPVFVLGQNAEIVFCNQFGDAFLRAAKVFRRLNGRLSVRRKNDDGALMSALHHVRQSGAHELVRFRQRTGEVNCLLHLDPVPDSEFVVASIAELRLIPDREPGWSRLLLGLHQIDAALSESIANGETLQEIADRTATPVGTWRTRLKKLFDRTGADSQTRLAALLLRSSVLFFDRK